MKAPVSRKGNDKDSSSVDAGAASFVRRRLPVIFVCVLIASYAVLFSVLSIQRHDTFGTAGNDLGNMDQAVWNTSQGRLFESTNWRGGTNRLGAHVEPILLLLAASYWIAAGPKTLLILQAIVVALGAVPIFWLARRRLGSPWAGLIFAAAYLLFPALQAANLYEFHPLTLTATFFALAVAGLLERRVLMFAAGSVLAVACKEDMPLVVAGMGLYAAVFQGRWRLAVVTVALSLGWFAFSVGYVIPMLNPTGASPYLPRYRELGASVPEIALTLVTQPWRALALLSGSDPGGYLAALLMPVGILAVAAPEVFLLGLPPLAENLLSNNVLQRVAETNHYPAPIVPFAVVATIVGAARIVRIAARGRHQRVATAVVCAIVLLASVGYSRERGLTPFARDFELKPIVEHHRVAERLIKLIPPEASVSVTPQLDPHLTNRRQIVVYPRGLDADYVFIDSWPLNVPLQVEDQYQNVLRLLANGYGLVAAEDGLLLLQRGAPSLAVPADAYRGMLEPAPAPTIALKAVFGDSVELVGYDVVPETPSTPYLALHLRAGARPDARTRMFVLTGDSEGRVEPGSEVQLTGPTFLPPGEWPSGGVFRALTPTYGRWRRPGRFSVFLVATNGGSPLDPAARVRSRVISGDRLATVEDHILRVAVLESDGRVTTDATPGRIIDLPAGVERVERTLGDGVQLAGVSLSGCGIPKAHPPCRLDIGLYWRAEWLRSTDETVFLHLVGNDGRPIVQADGPPAGGRRPASGWLPGEVVPDMRTLELPASLAPGRYRVVAGLYDPASGKRVGSAGNDTVEVGWVEIGS